MNILRTTLCLSILLTGISTAQSKKGISIRTIAPALFDDISEVELRSEDKTLATVEISTGQLREPYSIRPREFDIGITTNETFRKLASVTLPESGRDFILVFLPGKEGYNIIPVTTDSPAFRGNDTMVFNFMDSEIGVALGSARKQVKPKSSAIVTPGIAADETFFIASFFIREGNSFLPFNNTRWPVNTALKNLLFVFPDPESGKPKYKGVLIETAPTGD